MMNIFYNLEGVGDTLMMVIQDGELENRTFEKKGDLVRVYDKESGETLGYNLFAASKYGHITDNGAVEMTEDVKTLIKKAFDENDFNLDISLKSEATFVVGYVQEKVKHPNADKLNICRVKVGEERLQIVCGAPNVEQGQKVVVAKVGAVMPSGLVIKEAVLRGVESYGMICSAKELALQDAPTEKGILVLEDTYEVGSAFPLS